jgi:hypothetical protein
LSGSIPPELGSLTNLYYLGLSYNQLSGSIPPELGNLVQLKKMSLDHNRLSGAFPASITNLVNLTYLSFDCGLTSTNPVVIAFINGLVPDWQTRCLKNGGFETYSGTSKIPASWIQRNFGTLDGKNTIHKTGKYSVKITGAAGKTKTLTQTLSFSGAKGNAFTFSYWVKANKFPTAGLCQAQVLFYSGSTLKGTKTLKCPAGTTYAWKQAKLSFTAPAAYTKVVIKFTFSKASGTAWFDLVSLLR